MPDNFFNLNNVNLLDENLFWSSQDLGNGEELEEDNSKSLLAVEQMANEENSIQTKENDDDDQTYSDIFASLSDDANVDELSPWKFEMSNPFDYTATYVVVKSNIWPGAFTVAREKYAFRINFLLDFGNYLV